MQPTYSRVATLRGLTSSLHISVEVDPLVLGKDPEGEDAEEVLKATMNVRVHYVAEDRTLSQSISMSVWSDQLYDLLDLSLCLAHIADRNDTTQELEDVERKTSYAHTASWALWQSLFRCSLLLHAKPTTRYGNKRFISALLNVNEQDTSQVIIEDLICDPDAVLTCSKELRQIYEDIQSFMGAV